MVAFVLVYILNLEFVDRSIAKEKLLNCYVGKKTSAGIQTEENDIKR